MFSRTSRFLGIPLGSSVLSSLLPIGAVILCSLLVVGYIWTNSEYQRLEQDKQRFSEEFLQTQKEQLRFEVTRIKNFLLKKKADAETELEAELKRRVHNAHAIAEGIHQRYGEVLPDSDVKQMIVSALREVRFNHGAGYYFISSLDGIEYLYPPNPAFEGRPITEIFPPKIHQLQEEMVAIANSSKEGFVYYDWYRPNEYVLSRKFSYVKLFEPYGLLIGSGDYLENFEELVKERIFREIASASFGLNNEGYFFINSYQGDLFVTNGQYFAGKKNIWDTTDLKGSKVVQENALLARTSPEGAFSTYFWEKSGGETAEKVSFVIGMDEWQIFIGAGAYLDTIDQRIKNREALYLSQMNKRNFSTFIVLFIALVVIVFVCYAIGLRLSQNLALFQSNLERSVDTWTKLDRDNLHFNEFKRLAVSVNGMIDGLNMQAEELRHRVFHDHLTSLPNRLHGSTQLDLMISHTIKHQASAALLFIDLDHFKEINDTLGHTAGDELLRQVSQRLRDAVPETDIVSRLGGDEFTVITGLLETKDDASLRARLIMAALSSPFIIESSERYVTSSIGISLFPDDGDNSEILLRNADSAMYEAKRSGRNSYCFYTPQMTQEISERLLLTDELREAIEQEQFELFYQPQINLKTGAVIGAEALIRWVHPEKGIISPDKFIPMAEANGLIQKIGDWVFQEACTNLARWQLDGIALPKLAINISNQQMGVDWVGRIKEIIQQTSCTASAIELEITESSLMDNPERVAEELMQLKTLGVGIAIDDFGTGYSSLNYLKKLPISKLKIDQSFIRDLDVDENDKAITRAIVAMGQSLNMHVIAEGIESQSQIDFLVKLDCFEGQGYFYSKPLPEDTFLEYLLGVNV